MVDLATLVKQAAPPPPEPDVDAILRRGRWLRRRRRLVRLACGIVVVALPGWISTGWLEQADRPHVVDTADDAPPPSTVEPEPAPTVAPPGGPDTAPSPGAGAAAPEALLPEPPERVLRPVPVFPAQVSTPDDAELWITFAREGDIWSQRADGSRRGRLTNDTASTGPYWSPDGTRIVFMSQRTGDWEVWVMDADGSDQRNLTQDPTRTDWSAAWSPDGHQIAFYANRDLGTRLHVMNADGSAQRPVLPATSDLILQYHPTWSPDGRQLVFNAVTVADQTTAERQLDSSEYVGIYVVGVDGSGLRRIGTGFKPEWSPDGSAIAYQCPGADGRARICTMGADGSDQRVITAARGGHEQHEPFWAPRGGRVYFRETDPATGGSHLASVAVDGSDHRRLLTAGDEWWADAVRR